MIKVFANVRPIGSEHRRATVRMRLDTHELAELKIKDSNSELKSIILT